MLADVTLISFADMLASDDSVLADAVRHVTNEAERAAQAISGWSSYVDGIPSVPAAQPDRGREQTDRSSRDPEVHDR